MPDSVIDDDLMSATVLREQFFEAACAYFDDLLHNLEAMEVVSIRRTMQLRERATILRRMMTLSPGRDRE